MKIAISNLAWDHTEDHQVLELLNRYRIRGIEVAPTKVWPQPIDIQDSEAKKYKRYWLKHNIHIIALTSLLYAHPELMIFKDEGNRQDTIRYLHKMIRLSSILGAKVLIFGSPKNRNAYKLPKNDILDIAQDFFYSLAEIAKRYGVCIGIEAISKKYNNNFIETTKEAIELVKSIHHPNFRLHIDAGTLITNNEKLSTTIELGLPYTCHFHISEPALKPIPQNPKNHLDIAKILKSLKYDNWVSIEMPLNPGKPHLETIEASLEFISNIYG